MDDSEQQLDLFAQAFKVIAAFHQPALEEPEGKGRRTCVADGAILSPPPSLPKPGFGMPAAGHLAPASPATTQRKQKQLYLQHKAKKSQRSSTAQNQGRHAVPAGLGAQPRDAHGRFQGVRDLEVHKTALAKMSSTVETSQSLITEHPSEALPDSQGQCTYQQVRVGSRAMSSDGAAAMTLEARPTNCSAQIVSSSLQTSPTRQGTSAVESFSLRGLRQDGRFQDKEDGAVHGASVATSDVRNEDTARQQHCGGAGGFKDDAFVKDAGTESTTVAPKFQPRDEAVSSERTDAKQVCGASGRTQTGNPEAAGSRQQLQEPHQPHHSCQKSEPQIQLKQDHEGAHAQPRHMLVAERGKEDTPSGERFTGEQNEQERGLQLSRMPQHKPAADQQSTSHTSRLQLWTLVEEFHGSFQQVDLWAIQKALSQELDSVATSWVCGDGAAGPLLSQGKLEDKGNGTCEEARKDMQFQESEPKGPSDREDGKDLPTDPCKVGVPVDEVEGELLGAFQELSCVSKTNTRRFESVLRRVLPALQEERRKEWRTKEDLELVERVLAQQREARRQDRKDRREKEAQAVLAAATAAVAASPRLSHIRRTTGAAEVETEARSSACTGTPSAMQGSSGLMDLTTNNSAHRTSIGRQTPLGSVSLGLLTMAREGSGQVSGTTEQVQLAQIQEGTVRGLLGISGHSPSSEKMAPQKRRRGVGMSGTSSGISASLPPGSSQGATKPPCVSKTKGAKHRTPPVAGVKGVLTGGMAKRRKVWPGGRVPLACQECGRQTRDRHYLEPGQDGCKLEEGAEAKTCTCTQSSSVTSGGPACSLCLRLSGHVKPMRVATGRKTKPTPLMLHRSCAQALKSFFLSSDNVKGDWPVSLAAVVASLATSIQELLQPPLLLELNVRPPIAELINACMPPSFQFVAVGADTCSREGLAHVNIAALDHCQKKEDFKYSETMAKMCQGTST